MMEDDDEMGYAEKSKLPYVLLLDREGGRAAAYKNNHELIASEASDKLIAFAEANPSHEMPWSEAKHMATGEPGRALPEWATLEVRQRCVLLWIKRPMEAIAYWRSIPKR